MEPREWQPNADGTITCEHGTFSALAPCDRCPSFEPAADAKPVNEGALADESWCRAQRDKLVDYADSLAEERDEEGKKSRVGFSTLAKLYDTALKFHRAAMEERVRRDDVEYADKLERAADRMTARSKAH